MLYENYNEQYPEVSWVPLVRMPVPEVSRALARASLNLEHLSASFLVDASDFFHALEPSWEWPNLTSLALTSQLLAPYLNQSMRGSMLEAAAAAAMKMPSLRTMEIWTGREGLAMLFRYESAWDRKPAVITCRGSLELDLRHGVVEAWEDVVRRNGRGYGLVIVKELLGADTVLKSHGDAINHLKLSIPVVRPVSLRQILLEHRMRGLES